MKIAIIGSNTKLGQQIVLECEKEGISTICVQENALDLVGNGIVLLKRYDALNHEELDKCYGVIDVLSFYEPKSYQDSILPCKYLAKIINSNCRLIVAAPALFLYVDKQRVQFVYESLHSELSDDKQILISSFKQAFEIKHRFLNFLCAPLILDEQGKRSSSFKISNDILPVNLDGSSIISLIDYAQSFVELLKLDVQKTKICSVYGKY